MHANNLKFNFGFLIDASPGTSNDFEIEYPNIIIEDELFEPLTGKFSATRTGEGILIQGKFLTTADMDCIRCLEESNVDVIGFVEELFYYPPSGAPEFELTRKFYEQLGYTKEAVIREFWQKGEDKVIFWKKLED